MLKWYQVQISPYGHETTPNEGTALSASKPASLLTPQLNCAVKRNLGFCDSPALSEHFYDRIQKYKLF